MEAAAVAAVDATDFIAVSEASKKALKTANLLKSLFVNALILGQKGTGKKHLARYILPNAPIVDASSMEELELALQEQNEIIVANVEHSPNINTLVELLKAKETKTVLCAKEHFRPEIVDGVCSITIALAPLSERKEDTQEFIKLFWNEAKQLFALDVEMPSFEYDADVSQNIISLKRQVYLNAVLNSITEKEIMHLLEKYLDEKLGKENNDYRDFLHIYEVPLINAGIKKFGSQLQLSKALGLNRNTLRKKIAENREYGVALQEEKDEISG